MAPGSPRSPSPSRLAENLANERHGEATLRTQRRDVDVVQQPAERAHVARHTAQQVSRRFLGQVKSPPRRAQPQCLGAAGLVEWPQLEHLGRREA